LLKHRLVALTYGVLIGESVSAFNDREGSSLELTSLDCGILTVILQGEFSTAMHFDKFSFGILRIDGSTYEQDVVLDRGEIRKRKKQPTKKFRDELGHTPLSIGKEIPARSYFDIAHSYSTPRSSPHLRPPVPWLGANWNRFSFCLATLLCKQRNGTSEANRSCKMRSMINVEFQSLTKIPKAGCFFGLASPVAEAHLHGLPNILRIANRRVVRQGLGQRVGKAIHPVCCQESVG